MLKAKNQTKLNKKEGGNFKNISMILICTLLVVGIFTILCGCKSTEKPLPSQYTGTYSDAMYGSIILESDGVKTNTNSLGIMFPSKSFDDGTDISFEYVTFRKQPFEYFSDKTFHFNGNAYCVTLSKSGILTIDGNFDENKSSGQYLLNIKSNDGSVFRLYRV